MTARQLGETFDIARQNAHASIDAYRNLHPKNLTYNPSRKRHEVTEIFKPHYINLEPRRYLNYLRGNSLANQYWEDEEWSKLPIHDMDTSFRTYLETATVRKVVSAIQAQQALHLYYHAKAGTQHLTIAPNQLVYAGRRYHVRAYCYDWNKYIDLVLSRILEVEFSAEDWVSSEEDKEWNAYIELRFIPNPELPESLKKTLLLDFRLKDDIYIIRARQALSIYVIREMERLDWRRKLPLWIHKKDDWQKMT
ncbi:MAG: WYL domain-containing protein [Pseudomonadota bacterium]